MYKLLSRTSKVTRERKTQIFDFLDALQNTGIINMFSAADFLWSGSKWLKKWLDLYNPELLEEPIEGLERGDEGYFDNERIKQAHYLLDNANSIRDTLIMMLIESVEDPESIRVETQMRPFAKDFVKLWMKLK